MSTVVLKNIGTDVLPIMDFGTYGGPLSIASEDVFDYYACDVENIKNSDMDPEDIAGALELIEEQYDGRDAFEDQVLRLAPKYLQSALDEYGIKASIVPGSCHWYHPREYNFRDDSMDFDLEVDTDWVATTFAALADNPEFQDCIREHFSSRSGFISFIPNTVSELEELLDPDSSDYWKVVATIITYYVDQNPDIAKDTTDDLVEYLSGNPDYATFSMYGIY